MTGLNSVRRSRAITSLILAILILHQLPTSLSLRTTTGSPCSEVCHQISPNTTSAEIVCLDSQYNTTARGRNFQQCISCELQSTYQDTTTGETDVTWGLYNLRYAFTACILDYPVQVSNVSSPCLVTCTPLSPALELGLLNPTPLNAGAFCGSSAWADNIVTECEFCYNLTTNQIYLANFVESLLYSCNFRTNPGEAFAIAPSAIFTASALPSSTGAYPTATTAASYPNDIVLKVALPLLGVVILVCTMTCCCFLFIRYRRKRVKRKRQSAHLHERWNDTSMSTPVRTSWPHSPRGFSRLHDGAPGTFPEYGDGSGAGFSFVDTDGQVQEVGYAKQHLVQVTEQEQTGVLDARVPAVTQFSVEKTTHAEAPYYPMPTLPSQQQQNPPQ